METYRNLINSISLILSEGDLIRSIFFLKEREEKLLVWFNPEALSYTPEFISWLRTVYSKQKLLQAA